MKPVCLLYRTAYEAVTIMRRA